MFYIFKVFKIWYEHTFNIVNMSFQHDVTMCINVVQTTLFSKHNVKIKMSSNMALSSLQMVKESHVEVSIHP